MSAAHALRRIAAWASVAVLGVALLWALVWWATWPDVARLADHNPTSTAFIDAYRAERRAAEKSDRVAWTWVAYDQISPEIKRAVVSAEDLEFFFHHGFSKREMWAAFKDAVSGGRTRGASTITQQLAKNLWLSASRNPLRKVKEALLTKQLEKLGKRRILELYLNVVEFGPGLYGVEAAAQHYFGKPASEVDAYEAAELAASLPRPRDWHPGVSSMYYASYVSEIERRVGRATFLAKYLGGVAAQPVEAELTDSATQRLIDSMMTAVAVDTALGDTLLARDTASIDSTMRRAARRDSIVRDSVRRDSMRRDSSRHDSTGHVPIR